MSIQYNATSRCSLAKVAICLLTKVLWSLLKNKKGSCIVAVSKSQTAGILATMSLKSLILRSGDVR